MQRYKLASTAALVLASLFCCDALGAEGIEINKAQKALILFTTGARYHGQLQFLNSKRVKFTFSGVKQTKIYKAASVKAVETAEDTYIYNSEKGKFESARRLQAAALKHREEKRADALRHRAESEAALRGTISVANKADQEVTFNVLTVRNELGEQISPHLVFKIAPGKRISLKLDGNPLQTSEIKYELRGSFGTRNRSLTHPKPGSDFVLTISNDDLPPPVLVRIGAWSLEQDSAHSKVKQRTAKRLVAERGGILGLGKETGNFREEGGEEYETDVEVRSRTCFATTRVDNPTDRPIEVQVTLTFHFTPEVILFVDFHDVTIRRVKLIDPRSSTLFAVGADCMWEGKLKMSFIRKVARVSVGEVVTTIK